MRRQDQITRSQRNNPQPASKTLTGFKSNLFLIMSFITVSLVCLTSCTYKSPSTEVPAAVDSEIPKTFFVKI